MRSSFRLVSWLSVGALAVATTSAFACGNGSSSSGDPQDAGGVTSFSYTGQGCEYAIAPPESRALLDLALDDGSNVDGAGAQPKRVRLGLGGATTMGAAGYADPTKTAAFTWETDAKSGAAKVRIGSDPNALSDVRTGYTWTTPKPTVGLGTDEPETYMHEVHVCGLQPGKTYYYQVGGGASGSEVWSATQSFTTVPDSGKIVVGLSGDSRDKVEVFALVQTRMREAGVNLQLFSGDMVIFGARAQLYQQWLDAIWKDPSDGSKFLTLGQQMFVPIAGNHENEATRFYGNFAIPGTGVYAETYASFNVGSVHFVMLDDQPIATEPEGAMSKALLGWLEEDLTRADADRAAHPFVVAVSHRGLFSTSQHANDSDLHEARGKLAPVFDKHHVNLVVTGHDHEYERSKPLRAGADPKGDPIVRPTPAEGTVYVINAGAGASGYNIGTAPVAWREKAEAFNGNGFSGCYALLEIEAAKITLKAYLLGSPDKPIDTVELTK
jgi:hypothetical protein